jgi:hypothetical protein
MNIRPNSITNINVARVMPTVTGTAWLGAYRLQCNTLDAEQRESDQDSHREPSDLTPKCK